MIKIKKGLDIPITGEPEQRIYDAPAVSRVAVVGRDFIGLKPRMLVAEGDHVNLGQPVFEDRRNPGVVFAAPGTGKVIEVNRGERRILQSVVIELDDPNSDADPVEFPKHSSDALSELSSDAIRKQLIESGLWVALRSRPFNKVCNVESKPAALFVTAMDTSPLAPDAELVIGEEADAFADGLKLLCGLADEAPVHLCKAPGTSIPECDAANLQVHEFGGPHPAGLVGTHIHFLEPVSATRIVWTINYQDVIAIGKLFTNGRLAPRRIISLAGPLIEKPRLLATRVGAYIPELIEGELPEVKARVIAGSVLIGRRARGWGAYLGRNHYQVCALAEGGEREFLAWIRPGPDKFSNTRAYISNLFKGKKFPMNTMANGSDRAMVPIAMYETVMPQDFLATQLLRALLVKDTVTAQQLGCLELAEEDLSLCSFVCPSKHDFGPILRENLDIIEKEG